MPGIVESLPSTNANTNFKERAIPEALNRNPDWPLSSRVRPNRPRSHPSPRLILNPKHRTPRLTTQKPLQSHQHCLRNTIRNMLLESRLRIRKLTRLHLERAVHARLGHANIRVFGCTEPATSVGAHVVGECLRGVGDDGEEEVGLDGEGGAVVDVEGYGCVGDGIEVELDGGGEFVCQAAGEEGRAERVRSLEHDDRYRC